MFAPTDDVRAAVFAAGAADPASARLDGMVRPVSCVLVDEAQFLTPKQVDDLLRIAVLDGIPVLAYGIRTDFRTEAFPAVRGCSRSRTRSKSSRRSVGADGRRSSTPD